MLIQDYLEALYLDEHLLNEPNLDKIRDLFYELKERFDIIYDYNSQLKIKNKTDSINDFFDTIELLFMEYCYRVLSRIKITLTLLKSELKFSPIYFEFFEYVCEKRNLAKKTILKLNCISNDTNKKN